MNHIPTEQGDQPDNILDDFLDSFPLEFWPSEDLLDMSTLEFTNNEQASMNPQTEFAQTNIDPANSERNNAIVADNKYPITVRSTD